MYKNKECKGCVELMKSHSPPYQMICRSNLSPNYTEDNKKIECPCLTCLVKSICESSCDAYRSYYKKLHAIFLKTNGRIFK